MTKSETPQTLQQLFNRLDELETFFRQPDFDLEEALKRHEEATELIEVIRKRLAVVSEKIERVTIAGRPVGDDESGA